MFPTFVILLSSKDKLSDNVLIVIAAIVPPSTLSPLIALSGSVIALAIIVPLELMFWLAVMWFGINTVLPWRIVWRFEELRVSTSFCELSLANWLSSI